LINNRFRSIVVVVVVVVVSAFLPRTTQGTAAAIAMPPFMRFIKAAVLASSLLLALPSILFFDGRAPSSTTAAWESYAFGSALWGRLSSTWVALDCVCDACLKVGHSPVVDSIHQACLTSLQSPPPPN
jgi:hypothetical protein